MLLLLAALAFADPVLSEVVLDDGQVLHGEVTRQDDGSVVLTLASGTMLRFPAAAIREVRAAGAAPAAPAPEATAAPLPLPGDAPGGALPAEVPGEPKTENGWPRDPNRNRYLYSPSAFTLGAGRGYVSQKEIVLTEVAFGITDFWDLQAGTSLITLLLPGGQFGMVGTKLAFPVSKSVHLGAGAQSLLFAGGGLILGFGTVTVGSEDRHLSVNAGAIGLLGSGGIASGVITVSGNWRLGPRTSLLSENWFFLGGDVNPTSSVFVVPSFAVRLFGPSIATDLGVVPLFLPDSGVPVIPVPWVGFTWNFALPYAK